MSDLYEISIFIFLFFSIFLIRFFFIFSFKHFTKRRDKYSQYFHAIKSIINWVTFYSVLFLVLLYFSNATWMFSDFFTIGAVEISLFLILIAILIISFANRASKILTKYLLPTVYDKYQLGRGLRFTFDRVFHYVIMIVAIFISLSTVGIDLSALTVFAGVIGVGIGFGLQNIASNFISGLILLFERPIKVGDRVVIDDIIGDVEKINMRATIIRTLDEEHIIVPNSYFLEEQVINRSYGTQKLRLVIPIGVAYGSDVNLVKELLEKIATDEALQTEETLLQPKPFVNFVGFGDSSLDFELFIWIKNQTEFVKIKSNINFRIYEIFTLHNIEIPFPQRDLHVRSVDHTLLQTISRNEE
jgi:small-conductance mechanosensitive channel